MDRIVLHIDMNSYFATLEQQANPLLRGKPLVVSGRPHIDSVIAAASIEAKKFGVKSGMSTWEAKKLCPSLIFIPGDPAKYISTTGKLINIFKSYTPLIEIFSIDEVFLDVTCRLNRIASDLSDNIARTVALEIKSKIKQSVGGYITCSIGIAPNKLLAKLASEKKKPNGLTIINKNNLDEMLLTSKLDDFCGIGRKTLERLHDMGVYTVAQLRRIPQEYLVAAFGVKGHDIKNMAWGIDDSPVIPDSQTPEPKSFSHSLTLPRESDDRVYIESVLLYLSEKVARRMRKDHFCGRVIHCNGVQKALNHYTADGPEIFRVSKQLLGDFSIRAIYVGVSQLQKKETVASSLLPEWQKEEKIISALDQANDHFGENTVFRAKVMPVFFRDKNVAGIRTRFRFQ